MNTSRTIRISDPHDFNADPDLTPHQYDANLRPLAYRPATDIHFEPPRLDFERPRPSVAPFWARKLLSFH
jgi:hypothetical protein